MNYEKTHTPRRTITKGLLLLLLSSYLLVLNLQAQTLSDSAYASVLTCGPGNELYEAFGHSALRICDPATGLDLVYNYGTFDFDTPHFYWTFARGHLNYCLSRTTFSNFLWEYAWEGRAVWEQPLLLSHQELSNLYLMMETNYLPEYRYYLYDFFRDNCATRVRDMVEACLNHRTFTPETTADTNLSYRNILYVHTEEGLLWWRFVIDLALGARCDHRCSNREYMFSPVDMMQQFDTLTVDNSRSTLSTLRSPLAAPARQLLAETRDPLPRSPHPTLIMWLAFIVVLCLTLLEWRKGWRLVWMDRVLYIVMALLSLLVLFLWFGSDHYCTKLNWNLLWLSPLFGYLAVRPHRSNRWLIGLQLVLLLAALLLSSGLLPAPPFQQLNSAVFPLALLLALRLISNLR